MKKQIQDFTNIMEPSPITPNGQLVYSSMRVEARHDGTGEHRVITYTPDKTDAIEVLSFLDEINGISWTPELKKIEKELRAALHDLMGIS